MRETVAAKLTRDAANNALKIALASAVVDHIPVVGLVLGAFASAGDIVAITGIQVMLMLHIEAAYGRDPDMHRTWQLLPIIGSGFGWRTLARELSGFVPVAGIAIRAQSPMPARSSSVRALRSSWKRTPHDRGHGDALQAHQRPTLHALRATCCESCANSPTAVRARTRRRALEGSTRYGAPRQGLRGEGSKIAVDSNDPRRPAAALVVRFPPQTRSAIPHATKNTTVCI